MTSARPGLLARLFAARSSHDDRSPRELANAWSIDANAMRFHADHDGSTSIDFTHDGTSIAIERGARVGRGTRMHLQRGNVRIASSCVLGENIDLRASNTITLDAGCVIADGVQLQSDSAPLALAARVRVGRNSRLWAHTGPIAIGESVSIGDGNTWIATAQGIAIGAHCDFTHAVTLDSAGGRIEMNEKSGVGPNSILYGHGGLRIGRGVAIAGLTMLVPGNHRIDRLDIPIRAQGIEPLPIEVGDDVWIGANVVVLGGARIGDGAVIAAGAVVRGTIEPRTIVAGVPARVIATRGSSAASVPDS